MQIEILENGNLRIDDARIIFRNFSGEPSKFNRAGERNFALVIPNQDICDMLLADENDGGASWNVKVKPPRDEDEDPLMFLTVKVKFNGRGPNVYLKTDGNMVKLDEESVGTLDQIDIASVDLDIRPYDGELSGKPFRSAYLQSMCVTQDVTDRFAARYED